MARKAVMTTEPNVNSWKEVDEAMLNIACINKELEQIEGHLNDGIQPLKTKAETLSTPLMQKREQIEAAIKRFCDANRADFEGAQSKKRLYGVVGYRISTKIIIKEVEKTLEKILELKWLQCIQTKETPDKTALKKLSDKELAKIGASREVCETFSYEISKENIEEAA